MAVSHIFSNAVGDWTGTVTVFNSQGSTTTVAATNIVRPVDWNSAHNQFYSLTGNTTGNSTASGSNVLFAGSGPISVGGSTGTLIISAPQYGTKSFWYPFGVMGQGGFNATALIGNGSIVVFPVDLFGHLNVSKFMASASVSISTSSNSSHGGTLSIGLGIYTRNVSTLSLLSSGLGTYAWTNTSNNSTSVLAGNKEITGSFAAVLSLTPGDYWVALWSRTSTVNANWFTMSNFFLMTSQSGSGHSGQFMSGSTTTFQPGVPGQGTYSASSSVLPVSMAFTHITGVARWFFRPNLAFRNFNP